MPTTLPPLHYPPRTAVPDLSTAEQFVILTLRLWAAPWREPDSEHPAWDDGLRAAGILARARPAFDTLMRLWLAGSRHRLDVRLTNCRWLGHDEARLLQCLSSLQAGRHGEAQCILSHWLPPAAMRLITLPVMSFAGALTQAGLLIPARTAFTGQPQGSHPGPWPAGAATLH